jgi:hypothetical protein
MLWIIGIIAYGIMVGGLLLLLRGIHILNEEADEEEKRAFSLKNRTRSSQAWLDENRDWLD